jgi:succinate dehydrogenase / fumarate reductase flavoprotein subunit
MLYDVIIIGSGGSALSCAIELKKRDLNVLVVTKNTNTSSQTAQAQGGINAVLNPNDSIKSHIEDTTKSANKLENTESIKFMCENGHNTIKWLDDLGVPFSKDSNNDIAQRKFGGASFDRTCYSSDYTGLKIIQSLYDTAIKLDIEFKEEYILLDIIKENCKAVGIVALNLLNSNIEQILSKTIVMASGGYGGIYHNYTTNSSATTGDGLVSALHSEVVLANMEFVQFHPTALKDKFILISESARGEGGYLVTKDGTRFVDELLPRDIVARAIYEKILNKEQVYLDVRHLGYDKIIHLMPQEYKLCVEFCSLQMDKELIPIIPASHYTMGGIKVDINGASSLKNLYAVGECAFNGVHGANRLGGNSLLEIITFGLHIGRTIDTKNIIVEDKQYDIFIKNKNKINNLFQITSLNTDFYKIKNQLGKLMYENVGLFRDENRLQTALEIVNKYLNNIDTFTIEDKNKIYNTNLKEYLEFENMLKLSKVIIKSAIKRKESRGAHYRVDYNSFDNNYNQDTLSTLGDLYE